MRKRAMESMAVVAAVILSYIVHFYVGKLQKELNWLEGGILIATLIGMVWFIVRYISIGKKPEGAEEKLINVLILLGVLMRINYMLYTPCDVRYHDLWELDINSKGHAAYLLKVMQGYLPKSNEIQFYQQPFYYILGALVSGGINKALRTQEVFYLVDAAKTVSCIASCFSLMVGKEIFRECGLEGRGYVRAMIIITFLPTYYLTGGSIGPDALAGMFMLLAFWYTLKWIKSKSWKHTIILAIIFGLGMMTKISCASLALVTAIVFVYHFIQGCKDRAFRSLLGKYLAFGAISLPLGLWYSIRNYLLFQQPLFYVLEMPEESEWYTGNYSIFQRIFAINVNNLFASPYADVKEDYNLPVYALKSALFGEFQYDRGATWLPELFLLFATILAVCSVAAIVQKIACTDKDWSAQICILAAGIYWGSIALFYLKNSFGCSMDFRYMLFLPVPIAVLVGKCKWYRGMLGKYVDIACMGFALFSWAMFTYRA